MISRITRKATFVALSDDGFRVYDGSLRMTYLPHADPTDPAVALAFGLNRKFGKAVERNRARRRLRSAFVSVVDEGLARPGSFLVSAKRDILTVNYDEIVSSIRRCLVRLDTKA